MNLSPTLKKLATLALIGGLFACTEKTTTEHVDVDSVPADKADTVVIDKQEPAPPSNTTIIKETEHPAEATPPPEKKTDDSGVQGTVDVHTDGQAPDVKVEGQTD